MATMIVNTTFSKNPALRSLIKNGERDIVCNYFLLAMYYTEQYHRLGEMFDVVRVSYGAIAHRLSITELEAINFVKRLYEVGLVRVAGKEKNFLRLPEIHCHFKRESVELDQAKEELKVKRKKRKDEPKTQHPLVKVWNENRGTLPMIYEFSGKRKAAANKRLEECSDIEVWAQVVRMLSNSDFCNGKNARGWRATFDFLLRPDTRVKTLEGLYNPNQNKPAVFIP